MEPRWRESLLGEDIAALLVRVVVRAFHTPEEALVLDALRASDGRASVRQLAVLLKIPPMDATNPVVEGALVAMRGVLVEDLQSPDARGEKIWIVNYRLAIEVTTSRLRKMLRGSQKRHRADYGTWECANCGASVAGPQMASLRYEGSIPLCPSW